MSLLGIILHYTRRHPRLLHSVARSSRNGIPTLRQCGVESLAISKLPSSFKLKLINSSAPDSWVTRRGHQPSPVARTRLIRPPKTSRSLSPYHKILEGKSARLLPSRPLKKHVDANIYFIPVLQLPDYSFYV